MAEEYRTSVLRVVLSPADYRLAHESCHIAAGLWNQAVDWVRAEWDSGRDDPSKYDIGKHLTALPASGRPLHAHTTQGIAYDLKDAITTYRANRRTGLKTRAPWRAKNYRRLTFTRNYGWRIAADGKLNLSLGRGRAGIRLPVPVLTDSRTKLAVPVADWGEIRLCWDKEDRSFSLHIAHRTVPSPVLDTANIIAVDPGIINPMTLAVETEDAYEVTILNGRAARSIKHRRNNAVSDLTRLMSRCTKGSRQWRRYDKARKHASSHASRALRNIDHQVSRKAADLAIAHNAGTIIVGDVRGIEKNTATAQKRRFGKDQRRRLSQWSRRRQEKYLSEKTGSPITHLDESWSSKTCPACTTRNAPTGRYYQCRSCRFTCHRDAVGAINILMRAKYGKYVPIDPDKPVRILYLRATPLRPALSKARNRATGNTCVAEYLVSHAAAEGHPSPAGLTPVAA